MNQQISFDHLGFLVADLAAAEEAMIRLGFAPAPRSYHQERRVPDGPLERTGTANQCLMFRRGYIEVLGIADPARYSGWITGSLARYEGLHVIGFGHEDIEPLLADLRDRGAAPNVRRLTRSVAIGGEERPVSFTILFHSDTEFPEGRFVTMQHHTPDTLWHPSLLDHPNGAVGLAGVSLAVDDPAEFARRVSQWTGASPRRSGGEARRIELPGGFVEAMTPAEAARRYGDALPAARPALIGMTMTVTDLSATRRLLEQNGVNHTARPGGLLVGAPDGCGAFIHFAAER